MFKGQEAELGTLLQDDLYLLHFINGTSDCNLKGRVSQARHFQKIAISWESAKIVERSLQEGGHGAVAALSA